MNKKYLSVCIVVRKIEDCILKCIHSVKDIADEIIILNTCYDEELLDIPKDAKVNIYKIKWNDSYSEAKNFCLDKAKGRWVFLLIHMKN